MPSWHISVSIWRPAGPFGPSPGGGRPFRSRQPYGESVLQGLVLSQAPHVVLKVVGGRFDRFSPFASNFWRVADRRSPASTSRIFPWCQVRSPTVPPFFAGSSGSRAWTAFQRYSVTCVDEILDDGDADLVLGRAFLSAARIRSGCPSFISI